MEGDISRAEHEEFRRRMEEHNARQDKRIELLEGNVEKLGSLTASVEKLATNMENMLREQEKQGARLEALEAKPAKRWEAVVEKIILLIVAAVTGYVLARVGLG